MSTYFEDLLLIRMSMDAIRKRFILDLDALQAKVDELIPEDKIKARPKVQDWKKEVSTWPKNNNGGTHGNHT